MLLRALPLLLLVACSDAPVDTPPDASGGATVDASGTFDAGDAPDATDVADAGESADSGTTDAGEDLDAGDGADAGFVPAPAAYCTVRPMDQVFSGGLPPNPYGANVVDAADECTASRHDAIILLGCPSQADGRAAPCQIARVEIAMILKDAGYGDQFIVSGAAVHNAYVEADALSALLVEKGVPLADIHREPRANHTDENLYFSARIMESKGWASAIVVSQDPGQLIMTATCDANCCVNLGRLTVLDFPIGNMGRLGHFVRYPWAAQVTEAECEQIKKPLKLMCSNLDARLACADDLQVGP